MTYQNIDEPPKRPYYYQHGDFYRDDIMICGLCGKPKEVAYHTDEGMVKFPVIHSHQLEDLGRKEETVFDMMQRKQRWRNACFAGEFRELGNECKIENRDEDTQPEAIDALDRFCKTMFENRKNRMGRGLIIYGMNGRGKTFLAGCLCNMLLDKDYKVVMTSTRRLRSQVDEKFGSLNSTLDWLTRHDAVCLDDMFADRQTDTQREFTFSVVDALYKMRVPMIVTTNVTKAYLVNPSDSDKPTIDRIKERCEKLELVGRNRRQGRL